MRTLCSRRVLQQWFFALFLLCSPVPHHGRPIDALSSRMRRSVTHAQLMHDKGRTLQDMKRRLWLQTLLHEVHTAEIRDVPQTRGGLASSGGGGGLTVAMPMGVGVSIGTGTVHPKPAGGTKNLPISFRLEDEEGTNLPQETNKSQTYKESTLKAIGKRKKKGRVGKRREGEKRKRRARSLQEQH
uniref:Parathyroid hormone-like hormone a n=1 Tax=Cyprinus carpio TaxID=7962 RepID=A0A8C1NZM9_CYPCA